ncbi:MAG TPA: protein-disulfide reductase DsbD domain-containing protein, partial [Planctomycetaceae bacterium]|nr:protein-disulfide reductase DsbD domain-containing protein [Planctomycetaceae bacterium]
MRRCFRLFLLFGLAVSLLGPVGSVQAQPSELKLDLFDLATQPGATGFDNPLDASGPAKVDLVPADARPGEKVKVRITLDLPLGSYSYSLNPDFSGATKIQLDRTEGLESLQTEFVPDHAPKRAFEPLFDREVEKYYGRVIWTREFRVLPDARQVFIKGNANYQICDDQTCRKFDTPIDLSYSPTSQPELASAAEAIVHPFSFKERPTAMGQPGKVEAEMRLAPEDAKPGETVTLTVTMRIDEGWHSYSLTQPEGPGALPTELTLSSYQGLEEIETSFIPQQKY